MLQMTSNELWNRYFLWMIDKIYPTPELIERVSHGLYAQDFEWLYSFDTSGDPVLSDKEKIVLDEMNRITFVVDGRVRKDENRLSDAYDMRNRYLMEAGYPSYFKSKYFDRFSATVFEVLVALSIRCDKDIMGDPDFPGLTAPLWFWIMVKNLNFRADELNSEAQIRRSVDYKCDIFMSRRYDFYGRGGLYLVESTTYDLRKADLWMQLQWFCSEKFGENEVI